MPVRKTLTSLVIGPTIALAIVTVPTVATAETSWVGGGYWDRGADNKDVWSFYDHATKVHKASTLGREGTKSSGWIQPGKRAISIQLVKLSGNRAYYDFK